jgi:hypothetical protein
MGILFTLSQFCKKDKAVLLTRSPVLTYGVHTAMDSDAGQIIAPNTHVTNQRPSPFPWIIHFCWSEKPSIVPTNDVDFTCNSTSDIGTYFTELAVPFHIQYHYRDICIYTCKYIVTYSGFYSRWNFIALQKVNTLQLNTAINSWNTRRRPTSTVSEHSLL